MKRKASGSDRVSGTPIPALCHSLKEMGSNVLLSMRVIAGGRPLRTVAIAALATMGVTLLAGCGGGGSSNDESPPPVSVRQSAVTAADFNGDGRLDLAVSSAFFTGDTSFAGEVQVFLQNPGPPGVFTAAQSYTVGFDPAHVTSADLNGDGLPDLVTANESSDTVSVLLNQAGRPGALLPAVDFPCGPKPLAVAVGDLNRDNLPDIVVAVGDGVDVLLQNPNAPGRFLSPTTLPLTGGAFSVAIGDLDGDGFPDIACSGTDSVLVFFQNPAIPGAFLAPASFAAGVQPNGIAVADMDLDGLDDIVVANIGSSIDGTNSTISVLLQHPTVPGSFLPVRNIAAPPGTRNVALGDLNGDLFPDIAVASTVITSSNPGSVSVFLQNRAAPGNFFFSATYLDGFTPESVAIGDFNGDLRQDIAVQDGPSILYQDPLRPGIFLPEVLVGPQ